ncbi:MAG TPA: MFS transporter, partial [Euryarchaeota archaeon]|nr:MFS transporter [Euryarchaeota archaeon]
MSFTVANGKQFSPSGLTKLALLLASMMVLMGSAAVSPALHGIEVELETSKFLASMVISLPSLVVAVFGFPMGYLADRVGLAKVLIASLVLFIVAGVSGYLCTDIYTLLATRVFLGL